MDDAEEKKVQLENIILNMDINKLDTMLAILQLLIKKENL